MHNERWIVLAAFYPPHQIGGGEVSDHWIMRQAVRDGVDVTVWCEAPDENNTVYEGVKVRRSPAARQQFYRQIGQIRPSRVFISGPITVVPWKVPPATCPVLLLRSHAHLPLLRQLAPILSRVVVPSRYFKEVVQAYQPTFPSEQILVSYPNIAPIEPLPRHNPRFVTTVSAQQHKGIDLFLALAGVVPGSDFLVADALHPAAVRQIRDGIKVDGNLFVSEHHRSMKQIYFLTKVLLAPVVPSQHIETFGKAIAEAVMHGVPALTYPIGAPLEYLDERLLVPRNETSLAGQLVAWQEKLQWLDSNPAEVADAVGRSAARLSELQLPDQARQLVHILRNTS